jgi:hypothetical protein
MLRPRDIRGIVMSSCSQCGKSILFGGRKLDGRRYCSANCAKAHPTLLAADRIPANVLQQHLDHWRNSPCPRCKRQDGPVDVHAHHRVHSMILMTQWHTRRSVCCRRCGRRDQLKGALYSAALGWWGFPWGLFVTPIQIARNITGMCRSDAAQPTPEFERVVRLHIAQRMREHEGEQVPSFSARR